MPENVLCCTLCFTDEREKRLIASYYVFVTIIRIVLSELVLCFLLFVWKSSESYKEALF